MHPHESRETVVLQTPEEEDPHALSTNGQTEEAAFEQEQGESDEEEEPEGAGSEPEAPLDEASGEPTEPGALLTFWVFVHRCKS